MKDRILVINSGSSSVKADVFRMTDQELEFLAGGIADRIGQPQGVFKTRNETEVLVQEERGFPDHASAIHHFKDYFTSAGFFTAQNGLAIGHRVVHGGNKITRPTLLDDTAISIIEECVAYAPLHNPPNLTGIRVCASLFDLPQVAVFDTAFHATMPGKAYSYAIPREISQRYGIRRYGFHGTSHEYVAREAAKRLAIPFAKFNAVTLHLGNGASICAIENGQSVDTSMGFTPLEGLIMGTRSGDIDPAVVLFLQQKENLTPAETDALLNKKSGLLGLTGTNDMRDITQRAASGDQNAQLAVDMFCYRARKYLGAYAFALGRLDAIIFTGGIGENAAGIREKIITGLENFGIYFDPKANKAAAGGWLSHAESPVKVMVIATDEEKMIARCVLQVLGR